MTLKKMLQLMRSQTPAITLIDVSGEDVPEYLAPYAAAPLKNDLYYMGIKYATLETVTDDLDEFLSYVDVALNNYSYKWETLYDTTQLDYNPIWNVDGETVETRDIASRHTEDTIGGADVTTETGSAPMDASTYANQSKSNTVSLEHTDEHDEDAYLDTITTTRTGNIGVTSTQKMINEEREVAELNMLDVIMFDILDFVCYPMFGGE